MFEPVARPKSSKLSKALLFLVPILAAISLLFYQISAVQSAAGLSVEILSAYNLVVDSNVTSPSTYGPSVATVAARFCNPATNTDTLRDVVGYIGNYTGDLGTSTPAIYPVRSSGVGTFDAEHPLLAGSGSYGFSHLGGSADAARYIGDLAPGQCRVQYWSFTYPRCEANQEPPCSQDPVWGAPTDPGDDLYLYFDVWGKGTDSSDGTTKIADATQKLTMRNEISANANKIEPNPDGAWFNTDTNVVYPGDVITTNGVNYTFGNVNMGFDNDGDGVFDNNAWMQPFGAPSYDPSCFRLVRTTGTLTVTRSGGNPPMIINFHDQLYFTNLPADNTNVTGRVYYTFLALGGACSAAMTPYQEAASGADNEKFNGDYGAGIPPLQSYASLVTVDKTAPASVAENATITYSIPFANEGNTNVGLTLVSGIPVNMPFTLQDTLPDGLSYICGSASASLAFTPDPDTDDYTLLYSKDSGLTWSATQTALWPECATPGTATTQVSAGPNNRIIIQWRLNAPLPARPASGVNTSTGVATFQARVPTNFVNSGGSPFIENTACANLGGATANLDCGTAVTTVQGPNSIGDTVWRDDGGTTGVTSNGLKDGDETGIPDVTVWLYWDRDGDGILDETDPLVQTTTSGAGGTYAFSGLPDGKYLVKVDGADPQLPVGYTTTTPAVIPVDLDSAHATALAVINNNIDFGFGPALVVEKHLASLNPAYTGEEITFHIDLNNRLPGDGTADGFCRYTTFASIVHPTTGLIPPGGGPANSQWINPTNARFAPDNLFAQTNLSNNPDTLGLSGFLLGPQLGTITKVEYVVHAREILNLQPADALVVRVYFGDAQISADASNTYNGAYFSGPAGADYTVRTDITSLRAWTWADFSGDATDAEMQLYGNGGGGTNGDIGVDAAGYVITTNQRCAGPESTIQTLPLADDYDADLLQFLSADPPVSSATVNGTPPNQVGALAWDNLGPLYAGGTRTVAVTFRALAPVGSTTNTASVTGALFANGRPVNNDTDSDTVGIIASGSISGRAWADTDNSGWSGTTGYNAGDTWLPNVTLELRACYSTLTGLILTTLNNDSCEGNGGYWQTVRTTTTNASGDYAFNGLRPGIYNVRVSTPTLPAAFTTLRAEAIPAGNGAGVSCPNALCDNQWNAETADTDTFNSITAGENVTDVSFGYRNSDGNGGITGYIWNDRDADGVWDANEEPIPGVRVYLCADTANPCNSANALATDVTDASGFYDFSRIAGNYRVGVEIADLPGMAQSGDPDQPGVPCTTCDNQTNQIQLAAQEVEGPFRFGYTGGLSIGDLVWTDWNGDGLQDSGEEGILGVTVYLYRDVDGDGAIDPGVDTLIATDVTDLSGIYTFTNLAGNGNDYLVTLNEADLPAGYIQTGDPDQPGVPCTTCDASSPVTLTTASITTTDFGYQPTGYASIGDRVWRDADGDGVQDASETGIAGASVLLYQDQNGNGLIDPEDALVATDLTDAGGIYTFANLAPGDYIVQLADANFDPGSPLAGLTQSNGTTNRVAVELSAGETVTNADFGYANSTLGGTLWQDNNGNGTQDFGEPGIPNVTVGLYNANGTTLLETTQTDANGFYQFSGLMPGDYQIQVTDAGGLLTTFTLTYDPDAYSTNPAKPYPPCVLGDPDYIGCDETSTTDLPLGVTDLTHDFGYKPLGVIGDTLWVDLDGDQQRDPTEPGVAGVTVWLYLDDGDGVFDPGDTLQRTTSTDLDGLYSFGNLASATYFVVVDPADPDLTALDLVQTFEMNTLTPDNVTKVRITAGAVDQINDQPGSALQVDFGYRYNGNNTLNGTVFFDNDQDGVRDLTETTVFPGITVNLWSCGPDGLCSTTADNDFIGATLTNIAGGYTFTNLPDGVYSVSIDNTVPAISEMTLTSGSPQTASLDPTHASASGVNQTRDFGLYAYMDCGDLPNPYNYRTTLDREGPCHVSRTQPLPDHYLGAAWDNDFNGQGTTGQATGDDTTATDDEDGIGPVAIELWAPNTTQQIQVTVVGINAYLAGWFDWNEDFDFVTPSGGYDPGEFIYFGPVAPGLNLLNVPIPVCTGTCFTDDSQDTLYARFRLYAGDAPPPVISPTGMVVNGEVEDYQWADAPTAITLAGFSAEYVPLRVVVSWQTFLELDAIGFNLYRSTSPDGEWLQLNDELIPSQSPGGFGGASYEFIDPDVQPGVTYFYRLVFIDISGETPYGPVSVLAEHNIFIPFVRK
jgi:protocatechuate 3,4-dioxygenase beta subunit